MLRTNYERFFSIKYRTTHSPYADYVLIDERKARKIARTIYKLQVIGTARILVDAKNGGMLDNVGIAIQRMRDKGYWIHDDIMQFAMKEAGELK